MINLKVHDFRLLGCEEIWDFGLTQIFLRLVRRQPLYLEGNALQTSYQAQYTRG